MMGVVITIKTNFFIFISLGVLIEGVKCDQPIYMRYFFLVFIKNNFNFDLFKVYLKLLEFV